MHAQFGHFEERVERLYARHSRPDFRTGADGDCRGEDVVGSKGRGRARQQHGAAALGVLDHRHDGTGKTGLAGAECKQGVVVVRAVGYQCLGLGQRPQVQRLRR